MFLLQNRSPSCRLLCNLLFSSTIYSDHFPVLLNISLLPAYISRIKVISLGRTPFLQRKTCLSRFRPAGVGAQPAGCCRPARPNNTEAGRPPGKGLASACRGLSPLGAEIRGTCICQEAWLLSPPTSLSDTSLPLPESGVCPLGFNSACEAGSKGRGPHRPQAPAEGWESLS